jgi:two-component system NtrC family sensor kinase
VRRKPAPETADSEALDDLGAALLDALPVGLYVVDRDLRVVAWNRGRERGPLGKPRKRTIGQPLAKVLPPRGFEYVAPILARVFETGEAQEETAERSGGLFQVRRLPVRRGRKVTHVLSWFEDVTERRALEMRLIASDRLAFLGQLVAGVAHEVSNPLAGIAGCAEALASLAEKSAKGNAAKEARQFKELIFAEVARCERIVRFLLDSARPTADAGSTAEIPATVGTALRLLERHPAFARIKVVSRIPRDLPRVRMETESLKQVVMALAMNASKAMPSGGTLTLKASRQGPVVVVDVSDTGGGIPAEIRSRIFEPYFSTNALHGAGLGLPVARTLLRNQGGDLVYRGPRTGGGACFRVVMKAAGRRG